MPHTDLRAMNQKVPLTDAILSTEHVRDTYFREVPLRDKIAACCEKSYKFLSKFQYDKLTNRYEAIIERAEKVLNEGEKIITEWEEQIWRRVEHDRRSDEIELSTEQLNHIDLGKYPVLHRKSEGSITEGILSVEYEGRYQRTRLITF